MASNAHARTDLDDAVDLWQRTVSQRYAQALDARKKRSKFSAMSLAAAIGSSNAALSRLRNGQLGLSVEMGRAIARHLGVQPEWLLAYDLLREKFGAVESVEMSRVVNRRRNSVAPVLRCALYTNVEVLVPRFPACASDLEPKNK